MFSEEKKLTVVCQLQGELPFHLGQEIRYSLRVGGWLLAGMSQRQCHLEHCLHRGSKHQARA